MTVCFLCVCIFVYHCFYFVYYWNCVTYRGCFKSSYRALHVPFANCTLSFYILHFYERINDDDDDEVSSGDCGKRGVKGRK